MEISINTQSSIRFESDNIIYFDPYKIEKEVSDATYIFITHNHYDHFSPKDIEKVYNEKSIFLVPKTMEQEFLDLGYSNEVYFLTPKETITVNNIKIETVPMYNINKEFHKKSDNWCGYIITLNNIRYYIAGDTDNIKENYGLKCDVAFIPIGGTYTMNVNEAVDYTLKLNPKIVIPIHYGSIVGNIEDGNLFKDKIKEMNKDIKVVLKLIDNKK